MFAHIGCLDWGKPTASAHRAVKRGYGWATLLESFIKSRPRPSPSVSDWRRIDWRFLLPSPEGEPFEHLALLGGSKKVEELLMATGTASSISRSLRDDASADAVVVLAGSRCSPTDVRRALRPDGVLWWEISRARHPTLPPSKFIRKLRRAGLHVLGTYWVGRSHEHPRIYVPLDVDSAVTWVFESYFPVQSLRMRIARTWLGAPDGWNVQRLARWVPTYAVIASAGPQHPRPPGLRGTHGLPVANCSPLMLGAGEYRVTILPFTDGAEDPILVTKVPRYAARNDHMTYEVKVLGEIRAMLPSTLQRSLPEPLGQDRWRDLLVTHQSFIKGSALSCFGRNREEDRRRSLGEIKIIQNWLRKFHTATLEDRTTSVDELLRPAAEHAIERYQQARRTNPKEERLFHLYRQRLTELSKLQIPKVWIHGDFMRTNVYRSEACELSVVDWESAREGPALYDLLVVVIEMMVSRRTFSQSYLSDFRSLLLTPETGDPIVTAIRNEILSYMGTFAIDRRILPLMAIYVLLRLGRRGVGRVRDPFITCLSEVAERPEDYLGLSRDSYGSPWPPSD
jgi:hypothetical protein